MARAEERGTAINNEILFVELEWAEVDDEQADALLADDRLAFCRHYLASARRYRPHLLSEPEERVLADKSLTANSAWVRLFSELTSAITVDLDGDDGRASSRGSRSSCRPTARSRRAAADAVTAGLAPGLRTRAFVFNTLLVDKSIDDRLRQLPELDREPEPRQRGERRVGAGARRRGAGPLRHPAAVVRAEGAAARAARARRLRPHGVGRDARRGVRLERGATSSCSTRTRRSRRSWRRRRERFFDESWIDAPMRPGKRRGAFCAYTVPSQHPYLLLNWTARRRDVLTLAHEMGHGLHAYLAREQGIFHQTTPLTLAETASVFGETVTFGRLLDATDDPGRRGSRCSPRASRADRDRVPPGRDEPLRGPRAHAAARARASCRSTHFNEAWADTQPRCSATPSRSPRATAPGGRTSRTSWAPRATCTRTPTGSCSRCRCTAPTRSAATTSCRSTSSCSPPAGRAHPRSSAAIVGLDLADPEFWNGGLAIVDEQLEAAEAAARESGRL